MRSDTARTSGSLPTTRCDEAHLWLQFTRMRLGSLAELAPADGRVVIINVHTELVTTLALVSAHLFGAGMPIVLLDCDTTDRSTQYFDWLMSADRVRRRSRGAGGPR